MIGTVDPLVLALYLFAGMLLVAGGIVVSMHVFRKSSSFSFLTRRGIDPHLWGSNLVGTGFMLSLVLMLLRQTPWSRENLTGRLIVIAAVAWMGIALAMSFLAVLTPSRNASLIPAPDAKLAAWPGAYRIFIALGFAAVFVLGIMVF